MYPSPSHFIFIFYFPLFRFSPSYPIILSLFSFLSI
nr:MAG TPA: hypothetical protein [Caudoviricetes sp.]